MRLKILALTTFVMPLYLSVAAKAESSTNWRLNRTVLAHVSSQPFALNQGVLMAQGGWQKFSSPTGRFTVLMPGTPSEETQTDKTEDGRPYEQHFFSVAQPEAAYFVAYSDFPGDEINQADPNVILEAASEGFLSDGSKVMSQREISLSGYPGREIQYTDSDGTVSNTQIFLVGGRLYQLIAIASNPDNVKRFFDSFALTE